MELFHVLNRGVDKRDIFQEEIDYVRFIHDLYVFNDTVPTDANSGKRFERHSENMDIVSPYLQRRLVDIHGWVLMKNHYHLLLSERVEGGISLFLRKLNVGYAKYFNEKYERQGTLFQGRTKKIRIERTAHELYILLYIHLNPLDYLPGFKEWRERDRGVIYKNTQAAMKYLDTYRWSSFLDYCGTKNFPSIVTTSFFRSRDMRKEVSEYLRSIEIDTINERTLE
ncbi:MAG: transposase [Minisyncoccia bacterium]